MGLLCRLTDSAPEVVLHTVQADKYLIQMPGIAGAWTASA
jgi:hypothetical protein